MTTKKRLRIAVWIVLIAIAGLAGISFLHPFHTRVSWSESRLYLVSLRDGNLRIVHLSAELNMSHVQDSPLEEYAEVWKNVPTQAFTWNRNNQINFNGTPVSYVAFGGNLIGPILAFFLVVGAVKRRRLLAGSMREIMTPSDRQCVKLVRRIIRRSVVVIFGLATFLAVGTWVICYTGLRADYSRQFDHATLTVSSAGYSGVYLVTFRHRMFVNSSLLIFVAQGRVVVDYRSRDDPVWPYGSIRPGVVEFPCWAPVLLFSAWPIFAFIRGPYRRARRCAEGFRYSVLCVSCGYNLTGNESGVCPECGRTI